MLLFFLKRMLAVVPVALSVLVLTSLMIHIVPGDPVDSILGDQASAEDKADLRQRLGLDASIASQIVHYTTTAIRGDLGTSLINHRPVTDLISERLPATVELALCAMVWTILLGVPIGILSAVRAGTWVDSVAMAISMLGVATPSFWIGPMLVLFFSVYLGVLPVSGRGDWTTYILPSMVLGTALMAIISRMTRNSMLDTLKDDFVRTARAKGLSESVVIGKHAFRNAALPLVTIIGLQFGVLLTGAVITEKIFDWPGVGTLMLEGLFTRDYPVVQGCVVLFAMTYVIVNLITDLAYGLIDPRIRVR